MYRTRNVIIALGIMVLLQIMTPRAIHGQPPTWQWVNGEPPRASRVYPWNPTSAPPHLTNDPRYPIRYWTPEVDSSRTQVVDESIMDRFAYVSPGTDCYMIDPEGHVTKTDTRLHNGQVYVPWYARLVCQGQVSRIESTPVQRIQPFVWDLPYTRGYRTPGVEIWIDGHRVQ